MKVKPTKKEASITTLELQLETYALELGNGSIVFPNTNAKGERITINFSEKKFQVYSERFKLLDLPTETTYSLPSIEAAYNEIPEKDSSYEMAFFELRRIFRWQSSRLFLKTECRTTESNFSFIEYGFYS